MKIKDIFKNTNFPIEAQKQKENILQAWQKNILTVQIKKKLLILC